MSLSAGTIASGHFNFILLGSLVINLDRPTWDNKGWQGLDNQLGICGPYKVLNESRSLVAPFLAKIKILMITFNK